jgi:hypothetical protein
MKFLDWLKKFTIKKKLEIKHNRPLTDDEFNERRASRENKLNKILEKINRSGIESLSQHEKNFLENYHQS